MTATPHPSQDAPDLHNAPAGVLEGTAAAVPSEGSLEASGSVTGWRPGRWAWALIALLIVLAVAPLTHPGFFQTASGFVPAYNVTSTGQPPVWARSLAALDGEGRLAYWLTWPLLRLSGSSVAAVKWGFGLAFLLAAGSAYLWTRRWLGAMGGSLAAVVYTYLPWHLGTVYLRGAYAEAWLWALFPAILWAVDWMGRPSLASTRAARSVGKTGLLALAVVLMGGAGLMLQPGLAALFVLLAVAYGLALYRPRPRVVWSAAGLVLAVAIVWLTARLAPPIDFGPGGSFLDPYQLFSAAWGSVSTSSPGGEEVAGWLRAYPISYQVGLAATGLSIVAVVLWAGRRRDSQGAYFQDVGEERGAAAARNNQVRRTGVGWRSGAGRRAFWFWVAALPAMLLLTLGLSKVLWQVTRLEALPAQPWQLLTLAGLPLALLAGSVVQLERRLAEWPAWAGLVALMVLASYPYLAPRFVALDPGTEPVALFQPAGAGSPQIMVLDTEVQVPSEIAPTLTLTLTWQALAPVEADYTAFVHLLAADGGKIAQRDVRPCNGGCPTDAWQVGDIVVDRYQLDVPIGELEGDTAMSESYRLAVGLYLLETGERVAVVGHDDGAFYVEVP